MTATPPRSLRPTVARAYITLVVVAGAATVAGGVLGWHGPYVSGSPWVVALLCALVIAFERWPIEIPGQSMQGMQLSLSSTVGLGLLFLVGPPVALVVQVTALVVDQLVARRGLLRVLFNPAQSVLSYGACWLAYAALTGGGFTSPPGPVHPVKAALACAVFVVCNSALIGVVIVLRADRSVLREVVRDIRWQLAWDTPVLGLAPLVTVAAERSGFLILLLMGPIGAVRRSGLLASRSERESLHDPLTGLGNRAKLLAALDHAVAEVEAGGAPRPHAVLLLDLDHFKDINDTLGHHVGDGVITGTAELLSSLAPAGATVARLGGDEFAVLLPDAGADEAVPLAEALVHGLRQPREVEGISLRVRGSVGLAYFPHDGKTRGEMMRRADVALYAAKEGRDGYAAYQPGDDVHGLDQLTLANELAALLEDPAARDQQLAVSFQPLLCAVDGRLEGVECLVRWKHPRLGTLTPGEFLPLAEHAGLVGTIGRLVLHQALAQQIAWQQAGLSVRMSVNVAVAQLSDTALPEVVAQALARYGVSPSSLVLEVTEDGLMSDPARSSEILRRVRAMGVGVSIDDYGSGYSSLAYVKQLEVDELKIDRSYVAGVATDSTDRIIVQSTIDLAHALGLRVVAEGIEDRAAVAVLRAMGCDLLQGFDLARPGTPEEIAAYAPCGWPQDPVIPAQSGPLRVVRERSS